MILRESISEIGARSKVISKVKCHAQRHVSFPRPYGKRLSSHQMLDLPNLNVDCLVLVWNI